MQKMFEYLFHFIGLVIWAILYNDIEDIISRQRKISDAQHNDSVKITSMQSEIDFLGEMVRQLTKPEEQQARDEIRIADIQEKIANLLEHERVFDILMSRAFDRLDNLDKKQNNTSESKKSGSETLEIPPLSRCVEYVDYMQY